MGLAIGLVVAVGSSSDPAGLSRHTAHDKARSVLLRTPARPSDGSCPDPIILIPARLAATRLPDKPLADICGEPMIVHVWRRAVEAGIGPVAVATDSQASPSSVAQAGGARS